MIMDRIYWVAGRSIEFILFWHSGTEKDKIMNGHYVRLKSRSRTGFAEYFALHDFVIPNQSVRSARF